MNKIAIWFAIILSGILLFIFSKKLLDKIENINTYAYVDKKCKRQYRHYYRDAIKELNKSKMDHSSFADSMRYQVKSIDIYNDWKTKEKECRINAYQEINCSCTK